MLDLPTTFDEADLAELAARLAAVVGAQNVSNDPAKLRLMSEDIWRQANTPAILAVAPASTAELAAVITLAHQRGLSLAPRGAGASYTGAYLPAGPAARALDTSRLN